MAVNTTFECYCSPFQGCLNCDWDRDKVPERLGERQRHELILSGSQPPLYPLQKAINKRPRALTLPLPVTNGPKIGGQTSSQFSCILLTRLPIELRQKIWRECLEASTFHLYRWSLTSKEQLRLYHALCHSTTPDKCALVRAKGVMICKDDPRALEPSWVVAGHRVLNTTRRKLPSILLTCRRIYSDAIHYLYARNTLIARDSNVVQYLDCFFLPQRLASIRSFRFEWRYKESPGFPVEPGCLDREHRLNRYEQWKRVWKNLAKMIGLHELYVNLDVPNGDVGWQDMNTEKALVLLKPVMKVTAPKVFELWLPSFCKTDGPVWRALPCQIRKPKDTDDG